MRRKMSKIAGAVALVVLLQLYPVAARAQGIVTSLSATEVAIALQKALNGTAIHLHNRGPLTHGSYHATNASSIKFPANISGGPGMRTRFTLPDESRVILRRRYGYYVDHVRSTGIFVSAGADAFTLSVTLAAQGPALVGTCVRLRAPAAPCAALGDAALPAVAWRDARVDIVLKPVAFDESLAFDVQSVAIGGVFDVGAACEWPLLGARLCASLNRQSQRIRTRVANAITASLNDDDVRRAVAAGIRQHLDTVAEVPLLAVQRVSMRGGLLTIGLGFGR